VDNVLPGMEAAFVETGLEKNGFLYVDEIVSPELEKGHGRKIQDLISRGQTLLVQAVKDPMKTKGARLTTQISLPGRFVVLVPQGEGLGVSRRLDDDERSRLKDILKRLNVKEGGVIVRTAAEGASEEDIERDLVFLQRLWKSIQAQAKAAKAPELVYQEAELPRRVVGGRGKNSGSRLEDTITKNNLEAVKEVVRQLRLRDVGGIIVIDFIDMANPKNRATVEEALRNELERDRTKTYVVEISPLG